MGHLGYQSYSRLARRLEQYVPGTYTSETLCRILEALVSPDEAKLCALMPLKPVTAEHMGEVWKKTPAEAREVLEAVAHRGVVYGFESGGVTRYVLAPPVLGFFEFSLMRTDGKLDSKRLSELYYQYCQVEGDFIKQQGAAHPALARVFAHEEELGEVTSEVLSYDRVSAGIDSATCITTGMCYCRHKMQHMGKACDSPMEVCLTFNDVAKYLADYGIARQISKEEAHRLVRQSMDAGLVQIGDNTRGGLAVICNCCGCCCDLLLGYKQYGTTGLVSPSAFVAAIHADTCNECGTCASRCPVDAIAMTSGRPVVDAKTCLGCGVCGRFCPTDSCHMEMRAERPYVPHDLIEKLALASIDAGKLGNYLFDDQTSRSHAVLREVVNVTLRIPWVRRALLAPPVRRRILEAVRTSERYRDV